MFAIYLANWAMMSVFTYIVEALNGDDTLLTAEPSTCSFCFHPSRIHHNNIAAVASVLFDEAVPSV